MEGGRAPNTIYYWAEKTDTGFGAAKVIGFDWPGYWITDLCIWYHWICGRVHYGSLACKKINRSSLQEILKEVHQAEGRVLQTEMWIYKIYIYMGKYRRLFFLFLDSLKE